MSDNMRLYDLGRSVPKNAQKAFSNGRFSGTDINPMWRIKKLTEMFGPVGFGWYTEVTRQEAIPADDGNVMVFVDINLYVKDGDTWSKPIFGTGGNTLKAKGKGDDEGFKKAYTDALSIACKALGIGADIWYGADVNADYSSKYASMYTEGDNVEPIPRTGSAEAAQEAGHRKLEQIKQQMQQADQSAPAAPVSASAKGPATDEQIAYIRENADGKTLKSAMEAFGPNMEKMTQAQANKLIARIKKQAQQYNEQIAHEARMESEHGDWGDRN